MLNFHGITPAPCLSRTKTCISVSHQDRMEDPGSPVSAAGVGGPQGNRQVLSRMGATLIGSCLDRVPFRYLQLMIVDGSDMNRAHQFLYYMWVLYILSVVIFLHFSTINVDRTCDMSVRIAFLIEMLWSSPFRNPGETPSPLDLDSYPEYLTVKSRRLSINSKWCYFCF